jgi:short-subunit dehydrogenase
MAAEAGAGVLLVARNEGALQHIVQDLRALSRRVEYVAADVSRPEDHARIAQVALQRFGGFDTWVNGAAVGTAGELMDVPIEDQRRVFEVNYWGVVYGSLEAARHLRHRGGVLINIGSVLGERAVVLQVPYCAAKHAVRAFTDGLRMELEREGAPVSVTHIKPSSIDTPFPEHARNFLETGLTVPPPIYSPDLVAKAILFACENPRRDIVVGFGGWAVSLMGTLAPRLTDRLMEAVGYWAQKTTRQAVPARRDNLYLPRQDGAERSSFHYPMVRKSSLLLQAQMHPIAAAILLGGMVASLTAISMSGTNKRRQVLPRRRA